MFVEYMFSDTIFIHVLILVVKTTGGLACYNSWGRKESDTTERLM